MTKDMGHLLVVTKLYSPRCNPCANKKSYYNLYSYKIKIVEGNFFPP